MTSTLFGLGIIIIGAVMLGGFMLPMNYMKKWAWENTWALYSILGMIVFNLFFAFLTIPRLLSIYAEASFGMLAIPAAFGIFWGIGVTLFGIGMAAVGLSIGYAIIMGGVIGFGSFIPMIVLHPEDIATPKGILIITGLFIVLSGIVISALAGVMREKEKKSQNNSGQITAETGISVNIGVIICVISGFLCALPNLAFTMSQKLIDLSIAHGAPSAWAGNSVWAILFTIGVIPNVVYCIFLMRKNGTFQNYFSSTQKKNLILVAVMALVWLGSQHLYGVGARIMGNWGAVIGWGVIGTVSIATGNTIGFVRGEWRNTSKSSRRVMISGLALLLIGITVLCLSTIR